MSIFWSIIRWIILLCVLGAATINLFLAYVFSHLTGNCSFETIEQFSTCEHEWDLTFIRWVVLTLAVSAAAIWLTFKKWSKN
jgi:hypothetical protein